MNTFYSSMLPLVFSDFFVANADIHDHDTRNRHLYHTPFVQTEQTRRRVRVTGVQTHHLFSSIIEYKYSLLMHCIKIKSPANSLLNEQYVSVGGNISFLCVL